MKIPLEPVLHLTLYVLFTIITTIAVRRKKIKKTYVSLPKDMEYAGFWRRVAAYIIDILLLGSISFFIFLVIFVIIIFIEPANIGTKPTYSFLAPSLAAYFIPIIYFVGLPASKLGGTIGMKAMKYKIYNEDLTKAKFWRLLGRYASLGTTAFFTLGIGTLMIGWTKRKQGLHDMVARTICVKD